MENHHQAANGYSVSTDPNLVDLDVVAAFLAEDSYWAAGRPRKVIDRSITNSTCFGAYTADGDQAGFARLVTDSSTFGWVCDVLQHPLKEEPPHRAEVRWTTYRPGSLRQTQQPMFDASCCRTNRVAGFAPSTERARTTNAPHTRSKP